MGIAEATVGDAEEEQREVVEVGEKEAVSLGTHIKACPTSAAARRSLCRARKALFEVEDADEEEDEEAEEAEVVGIGTAQEATIRTQQTADNQTRRQYCLRLNPEERASLVIA